MKSNQITKSLAFLKKKITTSKYPLDQTFVPHFINKTHVYYLKCREGEKERHFLNIQVTKCKRKDNKRQKKERREKHLTLSILILKNKKIKNSFQLVYSSIGVGNKLGVFTNLHFKFVFCFLVSLPFTSLVFFMVCCWVFILLFGLTFVVLFSLYPFFVFTLKF